MNYAQKRKYRRLRARLSQAVELPAIPAWSGLVKLDADEVKVLAEAHGIAYKGLMSTKSALNAKAKSQG